MTTIGGTTVFRAMLIYFADKKSGVWIPLLAPMDEKIDCRLSSLLDQLFSTLILGCASLSRPSGALFLLGLK